VKALVAIYPEYNWNIWNFMKVPRGYWDDILNQKKFLDMVAKEHSIHAPEDWYKLSSKDIEKLGGSTLMKRYNYNLHDALSAVYTQYQWTSNKKATVPKGFWLDLQNQKNFFQKISKDLGIQTLDDWYKVSVSEVAALGGKSLLNTHYEGSLIKALMTLYPDHQWKMVKFNKGQQHMIQKTMDFIDSLQTLLGSKSEQYYDSVTRNLSNSSGSLSVSYAIFCRR
jgi:hypothetical protein